MQITSMIAGYQKTRLEIFRWRYHSALTQKIILAFGIALLTGVMAQIRFYLPWTPVPVTGQTFTVLLAGIVLGRNWGGASMGLYAVLGAMGLPWFAGWSGGLSVLAGPTGGYILGFILAASVIGHLTDKYINARKFLPLFGLMMAVSLFLIFLPGLIQLSLWLVLVEGSAFSVRDVLMMGFVPFIAGAVVKVIAAAAAATAITPKEDYR